VDKGKCPNCGGKGVIDGDCLNMRGHKPSRFEPDDLRWFQLRLPPGIPLMERFNACLACGMIWSRVSPEDLARIIQEHGTDDAKSRLTKSDDI
jgi:hypothetical protein